MALGLTQPLTEVYTRNISWGIKADKLTTFMCRFSCSLGALNFCKPQDLPRPVMGLLYLYIFFIAFVVLCLFSLLYSYAMSHFCTLSEHCLYCWLLRNFVFLYQVNYDI